MGMSELWENLVCECGNKQFIPVTELRYKMGGGTAVTPTGNYWCTGCQKTINTLALIEAAKTRTKKRLIEEKQKT